MTVMSLTTLYHSVVTYFNKKWLKKCSLLSTHYTGFTHTGLSRQSCSLTDAPPTPVFCRTHTCRHTHTHTLTLSKFHKVMDISLKLANETNKWRKAPISQCFFFPITKELTQSAYLCSCITVHKEINVTFVHTHFPKIFMNMSPLSISVYCHFPSRFF